MVTCAHNKYKKFFVAVKDELGYFKYDASILCNAMQQFFKKF